MSSENISAKLSSSDEITFKELIYHFQRWKSYILSKWLIILLCAIFGGILGYVYALKKKPIYIATTTFVLDDGGSGSGGMGNLGGLASMVGIDVGGGGGIFQGDNILELYKSRKMIEKTLNTEINYNGKKELLIDRYIDFNGLKSKWAKSSELKDIRFSTTPSDKLDFIRLRDSIISSVVMDINMNYLTVSKPDKKLSIIKAEVKAPDEFFAKFFNDQIVKNVNDFYLQTKTKKSLENVSILQHKADSVRSVMNGAIYSAAVVSDATPNLNPTRQVQRVAPVQKAQFSAETNKEVLGELVKNLEMSKMALLKETPLIQVVDQPVLPLTKIQLGALKGILSGMLLLGLIPILFLSLKMFYKNILTSE